MASLSYPAELKYTKTDEWVKLDGDEAIIGVSDYAQNALSDVVFVELPEVGASFKQDEVFGSVESVKAASDLHSPLSGTITAVNTPLEDAPEKVNTDPFGNAWFIKLKPANVAELDTLMNAADYQAYCEARG